MESIIVFTHTALGKVSAIISLLSAVVLLIDKTIGLIERIRKLFRKKEAEMQKQQKAEGKLIKKIKSIDVHIRILLSISLIVFSFAIIGVNYATEPISILSAPFDMTLYFYPSGWMGDGEKGTKHIQLKTGFHECNRSGDTDGICIQIRYQPDPNGKGWAGIYWQYPDSNWGDNRGRKIVKATKVTFWAKGESGSEIVEFKAGGINNPEKKHRDSFEVARRIRLNREWSKYEIPLTGQDLSHVIGAFAWVASRDANPDGLTFYIDDIRYE